MLGNRKGAWWKIKILFPITERSIASYLKNVVDEEMFIQSGKNLPHTWRRHNIFQKMSWYLFAPKFNFLGMLLTFYLFLIIYFYDIVRPTSSFPPLQYTRCPDLPSCSFVPLDGTYFGTGAICHGLWRQGYPSSRWPWSSSKPCFYLGGESMHEKVNGCNSILFPMVAFITPSLLSCIAYPMKIIDKSL
jgi:hypothetical protein